jgi:hypothetical protein
MRRQGAEASMLQRLWEQDPMSFSPPNLKILLSSCVLQISAVEGGCYKVQGLPVNGASWTFCCSGAAVAVRFHGRYGEVRQKCITVDDTPADQLLNPEQWAHRALSILIDSAVPEEWK